MQLVPYMEVSIKGEHPCLESMERTLEQQAAHGMSASKKKSGCITKYASLFHLPPPGVHELLKSKNSGQAQTLKNQGCKPAKFIP